MGKKAGVTFFEFDLARALFNQIRRALEKLEPLGIEGDDSLSVVPRKPGVYMLLRIGNPVYIGKADKHLPTRLRKHRKTISGCQKIRLSEMAFKAVCFAKTWDPFKPEEHLIDHYETNRGDGWNDRGFGTNEPGAKRLQTRLEENHL